MNAFLRFLDADIQNNPQKTRPFDIQQGKKLVAGMDVNIDDEIGDDDNGFPQRVNGWALYAHPCFQETYDALVAEVEALKGKDPENYQRKAATKLLAVVHKVIEEHITVNPSSPAFRHGKSLGSGKNKDWSRVKFGAGRYRLFFRYSEKEKVIILGWMNDENTLRTYGKKTDAYTVFSKMLKRGHPPADWESLTQETEESH